MAQKISRARWGVGLGLGWDFWRDSSLSAEFVSGGRHRANGGACAAHRVEDFAFRRKLAASDLASASGCRPPGCCALRNQHPANSPHNSHRRYDRPPAKGNRCVTQPADAVKFSQVVMLRPRLGRPFTLGKLCGHHAPLLARRWHSRSRRGTMTGGEAQFELDLEIRPALPARRNVGIGCIGAGFIMADCHLVAYRQAGLNPVAIASRRPEQARQVAARHAIGKVYASYQELLADGAVEVVDVAVPPDVQLEVITEIVQPRRSHSRPASPKTARHQLCPGPANRRAVRGRRHHAGRQPEHALRPLGPGLQDAAQSRRAGNAGAGDDRHARHSALDVLATATGLGHACGS